MEIFEVESEVTPELPKEKPKVRRKRRVVKKRTVRTKTEPTKELKPKRKERIPFGTPKIGFTRYGEDVNDGYQYRVVNDNWLHDPDRVKRAEAAGYEIVNQETPAVGTNKDGSTIKGVLMRIPKELYDEDQKAKLAQNDAVRSEIYRGKYQENPGDKRYIPSSGIHVDVKRDP